MENSYSAIEKAFLLNIGKRIKETRLQNKLSQEKFAQVCKLDRTYISDVERGERNISLLNLWKIAKALNTAIPILLE